MGCHSFLILLFCFFHFWCVFLSHAQLQSSQSQVLLQIKKQLEHPKQLETWENRRSAFCSSSSSSPSALVNVTCENNLVTELSIIGDTSHHTHMTSSKSRDFFDGFSIPNRTLSENFSIDSFVVTLARLTSLKTLRLVYLGIWGPLPSKIHRLFQLEHLDLSSNFLYGSIPPKISTILSLQILRLDDNFFNTTIPTWLFSLPNMTYLNLASNELNGSLENHLHCGGKLRFVDISGNKLTGVLPSCLGAESAGRVVKCEGNCLSSNVQHQHEVSYCTEVHAVIRKKNTQKVGDRERVLVGVIVGVFVGIVVLGLGILVVCRRYCSHKGLSEQHLLHNTVQDSNAAFGFSSEVFADERFISQASKLGREEAPMCRPYSFEEIKEATNNFDNSTFMGENLFGKIYRAKLENGKEVAIRRLALSKKYSLRNFKLRLDLLAKLRHPHLVSLLGHCIHGVVAEDHDATDIHIFLLYEYVPNGTFQSYLSGGNGGGGKVLNWTERLGVVTSIAKAVHFLHTGMIPGFFNNRLKSNNILLDHHFMPKLTDYGFSILSHETDTSGGGGEGTKSWEMKRLEDDIYGFGFILLEALVGPLVSAKREANLLNVMASFDSQDGWKQIVDPIVQATCCRESLFIVISITNKCISSESWSRPTMEDVLLNLQNASQVQSNNTHHNVVRFVSSLREVSTISV